MGKRTFKLPGEEELNKDQDRIYDLPEDGPFLVVGGPGTGKSVVALLRAMKYHGNDDYIFLTYNHVLNMATKQLVDTPLKSWTIKSWFYKMYGHFAKESVPEKEPYKPDYDKIKTKFESLNMAPRSLHLIIDEGQDMPVKFYEALMYAGYQNFFVVADQNQQITDDHSSRQELANILGLDVNDVIELKENFRNSHPVALFASHFFTDPASPLPELPPESRSSLGVPVLYEYEDFTTIVRMMLREADKDDRNLIGVVVANDSQRDRFAGALASIDIDLDNPHPLVSTYSSKDKKQVNIDFSEGGIVVLNDKSIKGLEFDIVFIIIDGFQIYNNDIDAMKKRFYVMSSRAMKKLVLFKSKGYNGGVNRILPDDEKILKRETVA
ncbi:conserved hypothetical protein [Desulfamplus magnetovallimortis]|uniref:DNA 3'-5' helicase II n=1 Tax=Desulfamplus magnetovallimortis TaxID=1246637 RepID=A0A1W1HHG5_9BACT|nr:DNA/RNA helicase domain-containing protein [Desulfamplus magnetovallimortis]SLM31873.1 conserved hypothetical protein [Desulfamplus magnetovallimortis]